MRGRPDVDLRIPPVVHPGDEVSVEMVMTAGSDTPIDFIHLRFDGIESLTHHAGNELRVSRRPIAAELFRLREQGVLSEGEHRFSIKLSIPPDAPPSYVGINALIRYELHLHVSIPWWPDLRETFELLVEPHPPARPKIQPARQTSARGNAPFIDLALSDTSFAPNDEVHGAFAIGNAPRGGDLGVEVSLVSIEQSTVEGSTSRAVSSRHMAPTVFPVLHDGGEVPFRIRVPKDAVPSFETERCKLTWIVEVTLRISWTESIQCSLPVQIERYKVPRGAAAGRPEIGAARWRRIWSEVGGRHALVLADDQLALTGARGDVQIEIALDRGEGDAGLVATLSYPSLGLGLRVQPQVVNLLPDPIEVRLRGGRVERRETEQCEAFFAQRLTAALLAFKPPVIDDTRTVVRKATSGFNEYALETFIEATIALVDALVDAAERVPPPAAMTDALPAWRAFASATGARLCVGGMALTAASIDGGLFDVTTRFGRDAAVSGTSVRLQIDPPLDHRFDLADPGSFGAAPPGSREIALALQASVARLVIDRTSLSVDIDGPIADPAELRPRLAEMMALARRLRGERRPGPYR